MIEHQCPRSVTGRHLFGTGNGICFYCAIDIDEIRHLLPKDQQEEESMFDPEASSAAISTFFARKVAK